MLGKICAGPKSSSGSGGLTAYLVGYAVAGKGASREEIAAAIDAVDLEAEAREDLGVGRIWSPAAGHSTRPSSILVRNCDSYATAAIEIDADGAGVVKHSALHFVWSYPTAESGRLTDEQVLQYAQEAMEKVGLGEHRAVMVVHRDTLVRDAHGNVIDGNLHVHAAVGAVHPATGMAFETRGLYRRLAHADREVELAHGLVHDRGLYVVRDAGTSKAHIEEASKEELAAWRRERREERLVALERRSAEGYSKRDTTFDRYADATVGPRLRAAMAASREAGREPDWATLHAVAARYGAELQRGRDGHVILRDVGIGELRLAHGKQQRDVRKTMMDTGAEHDEIDAAVAAMRAEHERDEAAERDRKRAEGETVTLKSVLDDDMADMPEFENEEAAERAFVASVEADPAIVLREITAQQSTFSRDDVDAALGKRVADPLELERLGDLVVGHASVRALEADTRYPLLTTTEILDIEDRLHADAHELSRRPSAFTTADIESAMSAYEAKQSTVERPFRLSEEQRAALQLLARGNLVAIEGLPGVGKTTIMSAVRELAEVHGKEIVGLTLSQAAAERLESEAGFACVNTARARIMEEGGEAVIPSNGIVVVDEAAMVDSRAMQRIVELAQERRSTVVAIGDTRQLQPIDAGASFRILRDVANDVGAYSELREVQRQKRDWHKEAVVLMSDAIVEKDDQKRLELVTRSLTILDERKAITWARTRDEAIDHAVQSARALRAAGFSDTLLLAADKDTVRHLAEEDRRRDGLEGAGRTYVTAGGRRELAPGDRFIFLENSLSGKRALHVRNGDTGEVVAVDANRISVRLDRDDGRVVTFSPRSYKNWDHSAALSVHKSQGASVDAVVPMLDRSASAELAFVAMTRSKHALDVVVPLTAFADVDDLARHVSERISLKTTTRTYDEIVQQTGGRETAWAKKVERAREALENPLRKTWQAEVVEPARARRVQMLQVARAEYARESGEGGGGDSLTSSLEHQRELLRTFRARAAAITAETTPQKFREWQREHEATQERVREAQRSREQQRQVQHRRERSVRATKTERALESDHGYER